MSEVELRPRAYAKAILHAVKFPHRPVFGVLLAHGEELPGGAGSAGEGKAEVVEDAWALFHSPPACVPMLELAMIQVEELCRQQGMHVVGVYAAGTQSSASSSSTELVEDGGGAGGPSSSGNASSEAKALAAVGRSGFVQELLKIAPTSGLLLTLNPKGLQQALSPQQEAEGRSQQPIFQVFTSRGAAGWVSSGPGIGMRNGSKRKEGKGQEAAAAAGGGELVTGLGIALEVVRELSLEPWRLQKEFADFEDHLDDISLDWLNQTMLR